MSEKKYSFGQASKMKALEPGQEATLKFLDQPKTVETEYGEKYSISIHLFQHPSYPSLSSDGMKLVWETKAQVIEKDLENIKKEFEKEVSEEIKTDKTGILIKADSLGSLEALLVLLKEKQIKVIKSGIGPITKKDVYTANTLPKEDKVILGFNVDLSEDSKVKELENIKVFTDEVIYKLIEDLEKFKSEKLKEIEREKLGGLLSISKLTILKYRYSGEYNREIYK